MSKLSEQVAELRASQTALNAALSTISGKLSTLAGNISSLEEKLALAGEPDPDLSDLVATMKENVSQAQALAGEPTAPVVENADGETGDSATVTTDEPTVSDGGVESASDESADEKSDDIA